MLHFDICCCTYRSAKWLDGFMQSLHCTNYDKQCLHLYFADNASDDDTVTVLQALKEQYDNEFGDFVILPGNENAGFGTGSNRAARAGNSDFVFFCNLDTCLAPDSLRTLSTAIIHANTDVGAFELRQFPKEHGKYYDPVTLETPWCSGAALVVRRCVFELIDGFDETIFMYCEDVDLSWRIRLAGYRLQYVPDAVITHFVRDNFTPFEAVGEIVGQHILCMKYAGRENQFDWEHTAAILCSYLKGDDTIALMEKLQKQALSFRRQYRRFYRQNVKNTGFEPVIFSPHSFSRTVCPMPIPDQLSDLKITVIIRTHQRPEILRRTLQSLTNQTQKAFRVLVVEDGATPVAEQVVSSFYNLLDLTYYPLQKQVGRCVCGNTALELVTTPYACFLDDDDYLFADYIESVSHLITEHPDCQMFCTDSLEARADLTEKDGEFSYRYVSMRTLSTKNLQLLNFFADNPVPIQAVVFDINLFRQYGGFDISLDAFEDWDLWIKYAFHCKIASLPKTVSIFHLPASLNAFYNRSSSMQVYSDRILEKMSSYSATFTAQQVRALFTAPADTAPTEDIRPYSASYREITSSAVWKIAQPLRKCSRLADFITATFGPLPPKDTNDFHALQLFVEQTKHAPYYRFITGLLNRLRHTAV